MSAAVLHFFIISPRAKSRKKPAAVQGAREAKMPRDRMASIIY